MDSALVDYLASSSGLETLQFTPLYLHRRRSNVPEDNLAYRFYNSVIPRHAKSLKSLFIWVPPDSHWCFRIQYLSPLMRCEKLDTLSLSTAFKHKQDNDHRTDVVSSSLTFIFNILTCFTACSDRRRDTFTWSSDART